MLYKGNKKFKTVHKGNELVSRIYKGDELIFQDLEAIYGWKFTIDTTKTTSGGTNPSNKTFTINRTLVNNPSSATIKIKWGDGNEDIATPPVSHQYANAGTYQITIIPTAITNNLPDENWLSGLLRPANINSADDANTARVISIDKPFPARSLAFTGGTQTNLHNMFNYPNITSIPENLFDLISVEDLMLNIQVFYATFRNCGLYTSYNPFPLAKRLFARISNPNSTVTSLQSAFALCFHSAIKGDMEIPDGLFPNWDLSAAGGVMTELFRYTFLSIDSSTATKIPADLFSFLSTARMTRCERMFCGTFTNYGYASTSISIPATLFSPLNTSSVTRFEGMFTGTFQNVGRSSTVADIPATLFSSLDTSHGTVFGTVDSVTGGMFQSTFQCYGMASTVLTIPATLFSSISTSSATTIQNMFYMTFEQCGKNPSATIPAGLFDTIVGTGCLNFSYVFAYTFSHFSTASTVITIPADLFANLDTSSATDVSMMFCSTFAYIGEENPSFAIPATLFSSLNTTNVTNFSGMFFSTFTRTYIHQAGILPATLFSSLNTSNGKNFNNMFYGTFQDVWITTIPATLFSSIDTSNGTNFYGMFARTFWNQDSWGTKIEDGNIPDTLFATINTSNGTNFGEMFAYTFDHQDSESPATSGGTRTLANLFSAIDTSNCTGSMYNMFYMTFAHFFHHNPVDISPTFFSGIDMSGANNVSGAFCYTFVGCDVRALGQGLFGGLNIPNVSRSSIFAGTFYDDDSVDSYTQLTDVFDGMTDFTWADASNAGSVFYYMFRVGTSLDHTSGNASDILQHFNFTPATNTHMFEGRTGLSDYATIPTNWK